MEVLFEEFRPIYVKGKKTKYIISNFGRVINTKTGKEIKWHNNGKYENARLTEDGETKGYKVHRLVALAFIDNPDNKSQVNHKDGNKHNNHVDNLEWATPSENTIHAVLNGLKPKSVKLSPDEVELICVLLQARLSVKKIAKIVGVKKPFIKAIKDHNAWNCISKDYNW